MTVDVLYVSFNRLAFTEQSFEALLANTDWGLVSTLCVADDGSTDGSSEYLLENMGRAPVRRVWMGGPFGGPVAAMNEYLDVTHMCEPCKGSGCGGGVLDTDTCVYCAGAGVEEPQEVFAKVDNDFVVCPGWLPEMTRQMELHPRVDVLGTEPFLGSPAMPGTVHRDVEPARHIGGKGLIRRRAFERVGRPQPGGFNGYQGFTQWQHEHEQVHKAWIKPDLPCFGLDQVRDEHGPWRALARQYAGLGWQRLWPVYGGDQHYSWWSPA